MKPERILVVDDERGMLRSVRRLLGERYPVATAATPSDALVEAREFQPDLAILDIRLPEMDGFQLMGRLREGAPDLDVIFMTGAIQEVDEQLIRAIRERAFYFIQKPFDRDVLLTLVERCLDLRRLGAENRSYTERLEKQLDDARCFQHSMLPPSAAHIGPLDLAARYLPCDELGGDFYDFADAGDGRAAVLIADVSGHGVSAAMLTAMVKSAFHDAAADAFAPAAVISRIASAIRPFADDRFVTVFCARCHGATGELDYVNAGHPPVLLWGDGHPIQRLGLTGPMISPAFPDVVWETSHAALRDGDRLLAYTDGILECRGEAGLFGEERLLDLLSGSSARGEALLEDVLEAVRLHAGGRPTDDDLTLLTLTRTIRTP